MTHIYDSYLEGGGLDPPSLYFLYLAVQKKLFFLFFYFVYLGADIFCEGSIIVTLQVHNSNKGNKGNLAR